MDCRILREISLKSDGFIHCDDSNGYTIHLGQVSESPNWNVRQVLQGPIYEHIRTSFQNGTPPWGDTCRNCDLFHVGKEPEDTLFESIKLRVEPTLACELACAYCKRKREVRTREGEWHLSLKRFNQLLSSCQKNKIEVTYLSYLGWGEPLNHPEFGELVALAKQYYPNLIQEVTTVAQQDFRTVLENAPIDVITISCDGVTQAPYEHYRRHGVIEKVFEFMADSRRYKSAQTKIVWKYIVFSHNDTDEELIKAQELADLYEIDELHFVLTNTDNGSKRFLTNNLHEFPLRSNRARVLNAAALQKIQQDLTSIIPARSLNKGVFKGWIDKLFITNGNLLICEGWLFGDGQAATSIEIGINGQRFYPAQSLTENRIDVAEHFNQPAMRYSGFVAQLPMPQALSSFSMEIIAKINDVEVTYKFPIHLVQSDRIPLATI